MRKEFAHHHAALPTWLEFEGGGHVATGLLFLLPGLILRCLTLVLCEGGLRVEGVDV